MQTDWNNTTGTIFNVQRLSVNDGPGIRTIVFLKGCPLRCLWCHNPESQSTEPQLFSVPKRCIGCGECVKACPVGAHSFTADGVHLIDREKCTVCGKCVEACVGALEIMGKKVTAGEMIEEVLKDKLFYSKTGGGLTISGGEPTYQIEFTKALLSLAKAENLNTCIETAGVCSWDSFEQIVPLVDLFLFDIKETDPARHREYVGVLPQHIVENLRKIDAAGGKTVMRCPIIPGYNDRDEHFITIAELANSLKNVTGIEIMAYHPLGESKADSIGQTYTLKGLEMPSDETIQRWIDTIAAHTTVNVKRG